MDPLKRVILIGIGHNCQLINQLKFSGTLNAISQFVDCNVCQIYHNMVRDTVLGHSIGKNPA